jgi:hypothetical protein
MAPAYSLGSKPDGFNIGLNQVLAASQTVMHLRALEFGKRDQQIQHEFGGRIRLVGVDALCDGDETNSKTAELLHRSHEVRHRAAPTVDFPR